MGKLYAVLLALSGLMAISFHSPIPTTIRHEITIFKPDTLTWKLLGQIKFVTKPHPEYGEVNFPVVNPTLKALNKKKVVMTGFIVPIDNTTYALSKNVFASCFFCGKAGPETIMGLKFTNYKRLKTDQHVTIEGVLRVNEANVDEWIYNLDDAVIVKGD